MKVSATDFKRIKRYLVEGYKLDQAVAMVKDSYVYGDKVEWSEKQMLEIEEYFNSLKTT